MRFRVFKERGLSEYRPVYLLVGDLTLLGDGMGQHGRGPTMEEVQDTILHVAVLRAKLVNPVSEEVCFRATQLVVQLCQPLDTDDTLGEGPSITLLKSLKPIPDGNHAMLVLVEKQLGFGHPGPHLHCITILV
jgi:hypothetical protein